MTSSRSMPTRTGGSAALRLRPDLPTRAGFDPDHPLARGLSGVDGPAIAHLGDLEALVADDGRSVEIAADATGPWILAMLAALAERRGGTAGLRGAFCNDPLASDAEPAAPSWSLAAAIELGADTLSWARRVLPGLRGARLQVAPGEDLARGIAERMHAALALLEATARREKTPHLIAAAGGIEFVLPGDTHRHRAAGAALAALWQDLLAERFGPGFERRHDLVLYERSPGGPAGSGPAIDAAGLRAALEEIEAAAETTHGPSAPDAPSPPARPVTGDGADRAAALASWRRERDGNAVQKSLLALREAAKRGINVMGPSVACAKAGVTTGEWAAVMASSLPPAASRLTAAAVPPPEQPGLSAAQAALERAARGLARPVTLFALRPGIDTRRPRALPLLGAARGCGVEFRETPPRRGPAVVVEAVLEERPHALCFCLAGPQSARLAIETLQELRRAGLGSIPALGLVDFEMDRTLEKELSPQLTWRYTSEITASDFLEDIASMVTLRKKASG